jgi:hypothetical protein
MSGLRARGADKLVPAFTPVPVDQTAKVGTMGHSADALVQSHRAGCPTPS